MVSAILVLAFAILLVGPWHAQLGPSTVWFHISYQQSLQHVVFILIWFLSTASLKRQSKQVSMSFSWKTSHIQTFLVGRKLYIVFRRLLSSSFLHLQNRGQWHSALYSVLLLRVYDAIAHCDGMQVGTPLANHTSFSGLNRVIKMSQQAPARGSTNKQRQTEGHHPHHQMSTVARGSIISRSPNNEQSQGLWVCGRLHDPWQAIAWSKHTHLIVCIISTI